MFMNEFVTPFLRLFCVAGPREAQGHTQSLLINSHNDNMLFTADGDQTEIGPDRLRVTGTSTVATCCSGNVAHLLVKKCFAALEKDIGNGCELNRSG